MQMVAGTRSALIAVALLAACSGDSDGPPDEPAGTKVTFSFCSDLAPIWLAVQDGDAPWVRLDPLSEGVYEARFTAQRGGVAYVSRFGDNLVVKYGNLVELGSNACNSGFKYVTGTVAGLPEGEEAWIHLGGAFSSSFSAFELTDVPDGRLDLLAVSLGFIPSGSYIAGRVVIRRGQDAAAMTQLPVIDFASAEAFAPAYAAASATGADDAANFRFISGWRAPTLPAAYLMGSNEAGPAQYAAVPLDRLQQGEFNWLQASNIDYPNGTGRSATAYFRAPTDKVIAVGPRMNVPAVTWPTVSRPRLEVASQVEYGRMVSITYRQKFDAVSVTTTSAYLGGTPATWNLEVPDLSSVDGWDNAWGLGAEPAISWRATVGGGYDMALGDTVHDGDLAASAYTDGGGGPFFSRGGFPQPSSREK